METGDGVDQSDRREAASREKQRKRASWGRVEDVEATSNARANAKAENQSRARWKETARRARVSLTRCPLSLHDVIDRRSLGNAAPGTEGERASLRAARAPRDLRLAFSCATNLKDKEEEEERTPPDCASKRLSSVSPI